MHAWEEWGEECFSRFNGQWALALWDRLERRLVLSRDRLGVRPLYYTFDNGRLIFASEVKAIFADPSVRASLRPDRPGRDPHLLVHGRPEDRVCRDRAARARLRRDVRQCRLPQGALLDADVPARGQEPPQDSTASAEELRDKLIEAIRLRFLRSDVPVAAYLSGGIDSSVTAAMMNKYTDVPLNTFSLRFADAEFDEGGYQQQMVAKLGAEHHEVVISGSDIAEVFPEVVWHAEAPVLRSAPAPMFLLSRLVRENGYKVVVTGEGADEVLGGYDLFREARVRMFWARGADSTKRARAAELLYPWMARSPGQTPAFARSFFGRNLDPSDPAISHRPRWDSTSAVKGMLAAEWQHAANTVSGDQLVGLMPAESSDWDPLSRAQWLEMSTLLPGYILASQGDRMLMGNSVEGRFPFLDRNVVEFAEQLPARHKLFGLREKYLLMRAFEGLVPQAILDRPKQPYRAPDAAAFFSGSAPSWVGEVTAPEAILEAGIFDPRRVAGLVEKCVRTGGRNMGNTDSMRVLAVLSTQLAHQQLIAQRGPRLAEPDELDVDRSHRPGRRREQDQLMTTSEPFGTHSLAIDAEAEVARIRGHADRLPAQIAAARSDRRRVRRHRLERGGRCLRRRAGEGSRVRAPPAGERVG